MADSQPSGAENRAAQNTVEQNTVAENTAVEHAAAEYTAAEYTNSENAAVSGQENSGYSQEAAPQEAVTQNATPQETALQNPELYQQKAEELQQIVVQQVMAGDTETPRTMTELLADEQGAFAAKAKELGLEQEWENFRNQQPQIAELREEFLAVEEQRSAAANKVASLTPHLEQESVAAQKAARKAGVIGAAVTGAGSAFAATKLLQSKPLRGIATVVGALVGGVVAAVATIKNRTKKTMQSVEEQMGDLANMQPDPALEQKAAELHQQLGVAQQQSMETMVDAMVQRMAQNELDAAAQPSVAAQPQPQLQPQSQPQAVEPQVVVPENTVPAGDPAVGVEKPLQQSDAFAYNPPQPVSMATGIPPSVVEAPSAKSHAQTVLADRAATTENGHSR